MAVDGSNRQTSEVFHTLLAQVCFFFWTWLPGMCTGRHRLLPLERTERCQMSCGCFQVFKKLFSIHQEQVLFVRRQSMNAAPGSDVNLLLTHQLLKLHHLVLSGYFLVSTRPSVQYVRADSLNTLRRSEKEAEQIVTADLGGSEQHLGQLSLQHNYDGSISACERRGLKTGSSTIEEPIPSPYGLNVIGIFDLTRAFGGR